jgi:hypothetical protein
LSDVVNRVLPGILLIVAGIAVSLVALDVIQVDPNTVHAPDWILGLLGLLFIGGGLMTVVNPQSSLASWSAGTVVIAITVVFAWVSLYGPAEQFSGDLPFLSRETNVTIARIVFGCVALLGLAITFAAARKTWGRSDR